MGKQIVKLYTFSVIIFSALISGCSFTPMQKAGTNALLEAHCLYEKKFNYQTENFKKCLSDKHR